MTAPPFSRLLRLATAPSRLVAAWQTQGAGLGMLLFDLAEHALALPPLGAGTLFGRSALDAMNAALAGSVAPEPASPEPASPELRGESRLSARVPARAIQHHSAAAAAANDAPAPESEPSGRLGAPRNPRAWPPGTPGRLARSRVRPAQPLPDAARLERLLAAELQGEAHSRAAGAAPGARASRPVWLAPFTQPLAPRFERPLVESVAPLARSLAEAGPSTVRRRLPSLAPALQLQYPATLSQAANIGSNQPVRVSEGGVALSSAARFRDSPPLADPGGLSSAAPPHEPDAAGRYGAPSGAAAGVMDLSPEPVPQSCLGAASTLIERALRRLEGLPAAHAPALPARRTERELAAEGGMPKTPQIAEGREGPSRLGEPRQSGLRRLAETFAGQQGGSGSSRLSAPAADGWPSVAEAGGGLQPALPLHFAEQDLESRLVKILQKEARRAGVDLDGEGAWP